MAHQVELEQPWRGLDRLARMAALAIDEALRDLPRPQCASLPMLLCVAEAGRPGRLDGLDDQLLPMFQDLLGVQFDPPRTAQTSGGRVGLAVGLRHARQLTAQHGLPQVLLVATDMACCPGPRSARRSERGGC